VPQSWKEDFFEKLVEASHAAGDPRLATATLHRRKKTVSYEHPQLQWLECVFDGNRISGNQDSQVLVVECAPRRGTEVDGPALKREFSAAGISGDLRIEGDVVFAQYRWGFGRDAPFPVHDPRRVQEAVQWTHSVLKALFDHLERRRQVIRPSHGGAAETTAVTDYTLALEKYLEDLLVEQWESLPWAADLEYLGRRVTAGDVGFIDILARRRPAGQFVVIELKRDQSEDEVIGQLSRYMGWVKEHRAAPAGVGVRGIVVAHEATARLRAAASAHDNVDVYLYKLAVTLQPVNLPGRRTD
jgi:Endonuclease NucS